MLKFLQRIGKALMLPIAVLPAAGLLLRFGQGDLLDIPFMAAAGNAIFANLALLFAIGVAVGLAKDQNGAAGLSGAIGYFILVEGAKVIDKDINMSVLGGILSGVIAGLLYNRYKDVKLPDFLGFFSGRRFVPIVTAAVMFVLAGLFGYIWPPIQDALNTFGNNMIDLGAVGAGLFGFFNRLLIPFGLHHVLNNIFWFVFGDFNGVTGDLNRFFANDPSAGIYMAGFFPIMMFGLPAAALAIATTAKKENRKVVLGAMISLAFTSFLTGITEPIEFSFMFLSPVLYFIHALLTGSSLYIANLLDIHDGFTFSAGAIDYLLNYGIATKPLLLLLQGLVYGVIYYFVFVFFIKKFNLKTPGREDEDSPNEEFSDHKNTGSAESYVNALGGADNIISVDNCATRLRLELVDTSKVNEAAVKKAGAIGVLKLGSSSLQVIVGTNVEFVAEEIKNYLK